ncbi:MAG: CaiB/BaiF CoA-transferase family protein [Pseudomonadota bacterium]
MGALSHLRVLDLSRVLAGPWASQTLADLGADVIKIERPGRGDDTRAWGPPWVHDPQWGDMRQSAYFVGANRNKRSVAVDITDPRGQAAVVALAGQCDVVFENFKAGGLKPYGLDHAALRALYPRLVVCSITGFGQDGPYAHRPGYDFLVQGMGGLMSITGRPEDEAGAGPMKVGVALTDVMTGLYASVGVLAALAHRDRTGDGQHIDIALLDVQVASLANQAMNYLASGQAPQRLGNAHPNIVPYQDFAAADGYVIVTVGTDAQFRALCAVLGHAEWAEDARFCTNTDRIQHRAALVSAIAAVIAGDTTANWLARLERAGVPCGPVNDIAAVFADPQVRHRGMAVPLPGASVGGVCMVASPLRLSATPVEYRSAAPLLGGDTRDILTRLAGIDAGMLAEMEAAGVVQQSAPAHPQA